MTSELAELRDRYHLQIATELLFVSADGVPSNADKDSRESCEIAKGLQERIGQVKTRNRLAAQTSGRVFESITHSFVKDSFALFTDLRPGKWRTEHIFARKGVEQIARFAQYGHLRALQEAADSNRELAVALGNDYVVAPDIVISRDPEPDSVINAGRQIVSPEVPAFASLRASKDAPPIMHASISCKWTIRSDRSQNARSEALSLLRNRKGRAPHIAVVTAEPLPKRIESIAMGTGDIDCIYHFGLQELMEAVNDCGTPESKASIQMMVEGARLRDIADLPLDLAV